MNHTPRGSIRVLSFTTVAFFLTCVAWFSMAPFNLTLKEAFDLTPEQLGVLMSANVALTIPARIVTGALVDRFGPRAVCTGIIATMSIPCILFALATTYWQMLLFRLLLSGIGAGFAVGLRMVAEWFPHHQVGIAEGFYGGWGNFGTAAAALCLPLISLAFGPETGWRWAIGLTGVLCLVYTWIYCVSVTDTPPGVVYRRPRRSGAMEVSSPGDLWSLWGLLLPLYAATAVLALKAAVSDVIWNLIGRPGGGWLADRFGRRRVLILALAGTAAGYLALAAAGAGAMIMGFGLREPSAVEEAGPGSFAVAAD